jgi:dihydroorotate dehydrogenase electron transfer subunit
MAAAIAGSADPGEEVRLLETREVLPGRHLLRWSAPAIARRVQPGQFVHVVDPRPRGLLLPAVPVAGFTRVSGRIDLLLSGAATPTRDLLRLRIGDMARLDGPLGRGFEVDPRSRSLLLVADDAGLARVRACVDDAVATGRQVTLLMGAASVAEVPPSSLLPDEVEYVVATRDGSLGHGGEVTDLVPRYEAWADQCMAAGSGPLLRTLAALARGRDARMGVARLGRRRGRRRQPVGAEVRRRAWLQVSLPHPVGCALGVCLGCVVDGVAGPSRTCREGPVFAATELRPEPGP